MKSNRSTQVYEAASPMFTIPRLEQVLVTFTTHWSLGLHLVKNDIFVPYYGNQNTTPR